MKRVIAVLILCLTTSSLLTAQNKRPAGKEGVEIRLVARYYENGFFDMSSDGKLLLLFGPSTPNNKKSNGVEEWKPVKKDRFARSLRVIDWESGRELGSIPESHRGTWSRPKSALFVEGRNQVCFRDNESKLWDFVGGRISDCDMFPTPYHHIPLSFYEERESVNKGKYDAKISVKNGANLLVVKYRSGVVTIHDRVSGEEMGKAVHPVEKWWAEYPTAGTIYGIALARDGKTLVTFYADDTFVWRIDS